MTHDAKRDIGRAFRAGWDAHRRHCADAGTEWHLGRALSIYLAREELDPDEETRRLVELALRVER